MGMTTDGLAHWQAEQGFSLLDTTVGDLLDRRSTEFASKEAVVYSGYPEFGGLLDIRWTYAGYRARADAVAQGLMALGLQKGDHIAVWAANLPEWLLLQMAAAKAGLVLVTVNPALRAQEVEYILKQGDIQALFFMARVRDHDCLATIRAMITPGKRNGELSSERLPHLRYACLLGAAPAGLLDQADWRPTLFSEMVQGGSAISVDELRERQTSVKPQDTAMIQYTSGTTGFPKGVMLSHYSIVNDAAAFMARWGGKAEDRACTAMPFFHVGGCVLATLGAISIGATLHPMLAFDALKALQIMSSERCTTFGAVPTMLLAMLQHPDFEKYDLSALRGVASGATVVPVYLMEQVKERMGADVAITFGMTESAGAISFTLPDDSFELKSATVGVPMDHVEVKVIDPASGQIVPCGQPGELCCRGFLVMQGYYNMPEKTAEAIDREGWLHSGDLATMDARGYVKIVGRLKDMVIRGGENIYPREVEEFLIRHPKIADVQVVGVPDPFFGEELLAVIIPKEGAELTEDEVRAFCKGQISHQKIPRYIQFTRSFPMTASGKVQKFILRERAIKELGL
jgi:fatty-acyl-CoA synthase